MAMNAAQIAKELETLEAKNKACAEQLRVLYQRYLAELSNTASQQLMAVCYHLCTQSYPEAFLGLSVQDRQKLQEKVRSQGERLRQQLSLEGLLLPDPGDVKESSQPRVAVIKAELTGDDLEVLTSALDDDNSDRILALLKDKDIELPFDLEAVMKQRRELSAERSSAESDSSAEADTVTSAASEDADIAPETPQEDSSEAQILSNDSLRITPPNRFAEGTAAELQKAEAVEETSAESDAVSSETSEAEDQGPVEATSDASATNAVQIEGYSSATSPRSPGSAAASETGRSLGRRFLEDILSGRALDRRRGNDDAATMSGEGSLQVEGGGTGEDAVEEPKHPREADTEVTVDADAMTRAVITEAAVTGSAAEAVSDAEIKTGTEARTEAETKAEAEVAQESAPESAEPDAFIDSNGFDPNFEPPPAEDRYEPTPLRSNEKLDISPGVLASALVAEGEDDKSGMLMRPAPYDGSTELSEEALRDPLALIRWVERIERGISQRLRQSSQRMTRSLEKSNILNNELPDGLLEAAVRPDGDHEDDSDRSMPHVLSLRLNAAGKENRSRKDKSIRIVAIYLRLSEIEFATPGVMAWRNQLRNQVKQLRRLSNQYQECKHAQSVVEAQALWREGWEQG